MLIIQMCVVLYIASMHVHNCVCMKKEFEFHGLGSIYPYILFMDFISRRKIVKVNHSTMLWETLIYFFFLLLRFCVTVTVSPFKPFISPSIYVRYVNNVLETFPYPYFC